MNARHHLIVIACGGRNYADHVAVNEALDWLHGAERIALLIHGAAAGADTLAGEWAASRGIPVAPYVADWARYGKSAGHLRNRRMLEALILEVDARRHLDSIPGVRVSGLVVAFPGGRGTADMIDKADKCNVRVHRVPGPRNWS